MSPNSPGGPNGQQPIMAASQKKHRINFLLIPLILSVLLLFGAIGFGVWAFTERETYKTKTDEIVAREVSLARQEVASGKDKEFVEKEKEPFKEYSGPSQFGSLRILYPKTWSAFITETGKGNTPIDGYLHPSYVPGTQSGISFALRVQVVEQSYDSELKKLESKVKSNKVQVIPYRAKNATDIMGAKIIGEVNTGQNNIMVMFPLRDKTIKLWTESAQFNKDFEEIILANLQFIP